MSKQEDNTQNQKLKDLFSQKSSADNSAMDDFEKEALEGFSMLASEKDALELKQQLDKRMYSEVFVEQKKEKSYRYWYAAAGLLLVVGFSIYLVQSSFKNKETPLALETPAEMPARPEEADKTELLKESETLTSTGAAEPKTSDKTPLRAKEEEKPDAVKSIALKTQAGAKSDAVSEISPVTNAYQSADAAPPMQEQVDLATNAPAPEEKSVKKSVAQDDAKSLEYAASEDQEIAAISTQECRKEKNSKPKKDKALTSETRPQALPVNAAGASGGKPEILCAYREGETALFRDVKKLLTEKDLVKKFDAILFVSSKGKVERAELSKSYDLSASQQKEVVNLLTKLTDFEISQNAGETYLYPYKLVFRP